MLSFFWGSFFLQSPFCKNVCSSSVLEVLSVSAGLVVPLSLVVTLRVTRFLMAGSRVREGFLTLCSLSQGVFPLVGLV